MKSKVLVGLGALTIAGSAIAYSKYHFHDPEVRASWMMERINKKLQLTDEQKQKLIILKEQIMTAKQKMHMDRQSTHQELLGLLEQDTLDRDKLLEVIEQKTQSIREYAPEFVGAVGDFYDDLSIEQRQILKEHFEHKAAHFHSHHVGFVGEPGESL